MTDHGQTDEERIPAAKLRDAVVQAAQLGDSEAAVGVIRRHWDLYAAAEPAHLLAAVRALPGEVFLDNAGMVVAADYLRHIVNGGEPHRFETDRLTVDAARGTGSVEQQLIVLTSTAASARTTGAYRQAVEAAHEARLTLKQAPEAEVATLSGELPHLFLQWGRTLEVAEEAGLDVQFEYEEAHRLALASRQTQIARRAAGHLAWYHARRGRLRAAEMWLRRAQSTGTLNPRYEAVAHLAAALIHLDHGEATKSAVELARMSVYPLGEYWSAALWVKSWHATTPAERALLEAEISAQIDRHPSALIAGGAHRVHIRAAWLRLGHQLDPVPPTHSVDHMLAASFEYRRGNYREAIATAEPATKPLVSPRARSTALVITSAAALSLQRAEVATHLFQIARAIIDEEHLYSAYNHITREHLRELTDQAGFPLPPQLGRAIHGDQSRLLANLTRRERQVLKLLPSARTIPDIANELFISPNTVKGALRRLYRKLDVTSREAAADIAEQARLGDD